MRSGTSARATRAYFVGYERAGAKKVCGLQQRHAADVAREAAGARARGSALDRCR